ncbi:MAG: transglycosylase domain-containing protein [Caldilineales bacterium]|nr:transglycosylase domain-containing protein [Caldilineales bacterium]MDW8319153.1 transglycosylase domain-containing protein [Anaerolineae bacterium]
MSYDPKHVLVKRRRRERRYQHRPRPFLRLAQVLAAVLIAFVGLNLLLVGSAVGSVAGVYAYFARQLPDASAIETQQEEFETVRIYDRTGQHLLYESFDPRPFRGDRTYLPLDQMSPWVITATVGLEDRNFWQNPGVNFTGLGRAFISNLRGGSIQGGSSITQQLIKNVIIDPEERYERSYTRKIKEIIMALEITRRYPKAQILEWYLNYNFYGNFAYGIEAASRVYFGKSAGELDLAEAAMLATIPQYPALNPINAPQDAYRRQRKALDALVDAGLVAQEEANAAKKYFDDNVLRSLLQANLISEYDAENASTDRAASDRVLDALVEYGWLDQAQADEAKTYGGTRWMYLRKRATERFENTAAPHFALYVLDELQRRFNTVNDPYFIWRNGLQVYTTLDYDLQKAAECAARIRIAALEGIKPKDYVPPAGTPPDACDEFKSMDMQPNLPNVDHNAHNAAVVAIRPPTGEILAMVGSIDYNNEEIDGEVNMALAPRQPGSSFKPFTYLAAFLQGYTPATRIMDVRTVFPNPPEPPYVPENFDRKYHGPQLARYALARSYNIPAVWMMDKVGVKTVIDLAHRMGINTLDKEHYGLSLTLGGGEVTLLDMTFANAVLANGGVMAGQPVPPDRQRPGYRKLDPVSILQVRDKTGQIIYQYDQPSTERIVDERYVYLIQDILSDYNARKAAFGDWSRFLELPDRKIAVKTGTTNNWRDGWTLGFTPQLALGVWTGNADNTPMYETPGSRGAAPIFRAIAEWALTKRGEPVLTFKRPPGIVERTVCWESGLLPTPDCGRVVREIFVAGTEPTQYDTVWRAFEINRENGKLATIYTPPELRERRVYQIYPPEAADWVREQGIPQPPTEYDTTVGPQAVDFEAAIISPAPYSYVKGVVQIRGNARLGDFRSYRVEVGEGVNPGAWTQIGPEHYNQVGEDVLEVWDTSGFSGLYSLRVVVTRNDGSTKEGVVQVTVDNTPPTVQVLAPAEGQRFVTEDDEWVSITAEATDDWAMERVDFYLNGAKIGTSTVSPYSRRWDLKLIGRNTPQTLVRETRLEDGTVITETVPAASFLQPEVDRNGRPTGRTYTMFENGFGFTVDASGNYTETHLIEVRAFDRAGNETRSQPLRIFVAKKPPKKDKATGALPVPPTALRAGDERRPVAAGFPATPRAAWPAATPRSRAQNPLL